MFIRTVISYHYHHYQPLQIVRLRHENVWEKQREPAHIAKKIEQNPGSLF